MTIAELRRLPQSYQDVYGLAASCAAHARRVWGEQSAEALTAAATLAVVTAALRARMGRGAAA